MKKWISLLLAGCMTLSLAACGAAAKDPYIDKDGVPSFGVSATDYADFAYLYQERLTTESKENEETGKMESRDVLVYIPKDEYTYVSRRRATAEALSVDFSLELEPYLYKQEDHTLQENLDGVIADMFDPEELYPEGKGVESSQAALSEDGKTATATVSYFPYNKYDKEFYYLYTFLALYELEDDTYALLTVTVDSRDATAKTQELLAELEKFYRVDIGWDAQAAQARLDEFLASDEAQMPAFSTGYMSFDLPEGWEETDETDTYAPGGDAGFSGCFLQVEREYVGMSGKELIARGLSEEELAEVLSSIVGLPSEKVSVEKVDSALGAGYYLTVLVESEGYSVQVKTAFLFDDEGYWYIFAGGANDQYPGAAEALDEGLETLMSTVELAG